MTTPNPVASEVIPTSKKKSFFRWSLVFQLFTLVLVFTVGFVLARALTPSKATSTKSAQSYPSQVTTSPPSTQSRQAKSSSSRSVSSNSLQSKIESKAAVQDYAKTQSTGSRASFAAAPTETNRIKSNVGVGFSMPSLGHLPPPVTSYNGMAMPSPIKNRGSNSIVTTGYSTLPVFTTAFTNPNASTEEQETERVIADLTAQVHQATDDKRAILIEGLKAKIVELFKLRHAAQQKEIEEMEKQHVEAKALHAKRGEKQVEIVERRLRNLMNEVDDLDWERKLTSAAIQVYNGAVPPVPHSVH